MTPLPTPQFTIEPLLLISTLWLVALLESIETSKCASFKCQLISSAISSAAHNLAPSSDLYTMARFPLESIETSKCASFKCHRFTMLTTMEA
ncbi:hypothetical protein VNO78_26954 [Psophocarpus tetragonolobus]|uniref:Secreted protein n=1 Tax=Psophocarpus tetragonolobus TaxID=3891 RepID=A0AAN9RZZ2_PSOTE